MKDDILAILKPLVPDGTSVDISVPEQENFGHYSTSIAMRLASALSGKTESAAPMEIADGLVVKIKETAPAGFFEKIEVAAPGFINFWLSAKTIRETFVKIAADKKYGGNDSGKKKTVIVDYSAVNIAKPFHLGHFRTTIIGDALANIFEYSGYKVVRWNYLGDWGTQFGKLIVAYRLWGNEKDIERNPIGELQKLYVRFHEEAKTNADLEERARREFKKLEEGDAENRKTWKWFRKESLLAFDKIYAALDVDFDVWIGESFFEREMKPTAKELLDRGIAERSDGAVIVRLDAEELPPALIEKSDGASLYLTRDIANLRYRIKKYKPATILYVVANEQTLHFEQLFSIAKRLHYSGVLLRHVKYGMVLGETGKKFSTRKGEAVFLEEILEKAFELARAAIQEKNTDLSAGEKNEIASAIGIGALKYNDLKENRMTDIVFNWERMLAFTGDSGPYLQYTYARLKSIIRKSEAESLKLKVDFEMLDSETELALMRKIFEFPDAIKKSGELLMTSGLANYLYKLAIVANKFYETTPILKDENERRRAGRLALALTTARVLKTGLGLLGIKTPEKI